MSRRRLLRLGSGLLTLAVASGLLAACGEATPAVDATASATAAADTPATAPPTGAQATAPAATPHGGVVRAAFIYPGPSNDHGWSNAHDDGRRALELALGSAVETAYTENVPATDAQAVLEDYARSGYDVIYATSAGFTDSVLATARSFPQVRFEQCAGSKVAPNLATYDAAEEEPRYVSGTLAGKLTKTNRLGFVASLPTPYVVRCLNAFAAGVQATNSDARIHVVWIGAWFDPPKEQSAAEALLDLNADVLTGTASSPALAQAAAARGKFAVGVDYDQASLAPQAVVQSDRFVWAPHYLGSVRSILDGTWQPAPRYYHMRDGLVEATPPSPAVPADVAAAAMDLASQIKAGTFNIWQGPLVDNHGNVQAPAGKSLGDFLDPSTTPANGQSRDDVYVQSTQMSWALSNILGDLPTADLPNGH